MSNEIVLQETKPTGRVRVAFKDVSNRAKFQVSKNAKSKNFKPLAKLSTVPCIKKRDAQALNESTNAAREVNAAIKIESNTTSVPKKIFERVNEATQSLENDIVNLEIKDPSKVEVLKNPKPGASIISGELHNIDERDADDELCVTAYVGDMYEYFRKEEHRTTVDPAYMDAQKEMNPRMRAILVDWISVVCTKTKLSPEVFHVTVNILDRYLSSSKATKSSLQLIGAASLFISSKYEDIYPVPADDLVYLCDNTYSHNELYKMEEKILRALNYQISLPTTYKFVLRFLNAGHANREMVYLTSYIAESTMLSIDFIKHLPSELAAASVLIARKAVGRNPWSITLVKYAEYKEEDIIPLARAMVIAITKLSPDLNSLKQKYSSEKRMRVSSIPLPSDL